MVALFVFSTLFAFVHQGYILFGFVLGMVFGIVFGISRSLVPVILRHIIWNIFALFYFNYI
ncbi:CPBP family glutamic-type intramembrane protease [Lentibacillus persicus]|uniref:CPBP family glutamic-type intramembrane protease n=1 Tax=Lentibacillus persicus TaxID=640948 RepID=UPI000B7FBA39